MFPKAIFILTNTGHNLYNRKQLNKNDGTSI